MIDAPQTTDDIPVINRRNSASIKLKNKLLQLMSLSDPQPHRRAAVCISAESDAYPK